MRPPRTDLETSRTLHVAYVGPIDFPSSSAPAQRMLGIIQALNSAGDRVSVGSGGYDDHVPAAFSGRPREVTGLGELPNPGWPKLRRIMRGLSWGTATRNWILKMDPAPDVILVYGTALGYLTRLIPLARQRGIPLVIDVTEWYESSHLPGGRWGPFALANRLSMGWLASKADGVIPISRFLENHFSSKGVPTLRIPPLFDIEDRAGVSFNRHEPLTLCYVGSPGLKDRQSISNLILLPGTLGCTSDQLRVHIVGVDQTAAAALLSDEARAAIEHECLVFHGHLMSPSARKIIVESHFSVLQRAPQRYAQAGYPSKVPESLLLGTPVMANLTSDLADVLVDGKNSVILTGTSLDSLASKISHALSKPYEFDRESIAAAARTVYSPALYKRSLHDFLAAPDMRGLNSRGSRPGY